MRAQITDSHFMVPRSRSSARSNVKVTLPKIMTVSRALVFHKDMLLLIETVKYVPKNVSEGCFEDEVSLLWNTVVP